MKNSEVLDLSVTIYPEESAENFAFDACEAAYLIAVKYKREDVVRRLLITMEFKPSPLLSYETLTEEGKEIYTMLEYDVKRIDDAYNASFHQWYLDQYRAQN